MTAPMVVLTLVVLLLAVLVVGLLKSHAEILRALHDLGVNMEDGAPQQGASTFGLGSRGAEARSEADLGNGVMPAGTPPGERIGDSELALPTAGPLGDAHDLMGTTPLGEAAAISVRGSDRLTLLAFLTSGCETCLDFWHAFEDEENRRVAGSRSRLVVLTRGLEEESPSSVANLAHGDLEVLMSSEAFDDYSVPVAPYFVLVAEGRVIGEGAAGSYDQLGSLMSKALADGGYGMGATRNRRDVLRGRLSRPSADDALESAGIGPGHPSLHEDPQTDRADSGADGSGVTS